MPVSETQNNYSWLINILYGLQEDNYLKTILQKKNHFLEMQHKGFLNRRQQRFEE